jgi:ABC-2 type transport system ATP-binding protein
MTIIVDSLGKEFLVKQCIKKNYFINRYKKTSVFAIKDISFHIKQGESVAFIGPNGAGKSTTLKILSGILYPSSGYATVAELVPWKNRHQLSFFIGLVFGQSSQLWYHLPVKSSFDLLGKIYELKDIDYKHQLEILSNKFGLKNLFDKPVKTLSLGQRMCCEIAASLLHKPKILFLDEPTIGLDIVAKAELRDHLKTINAQGTTILLTSHDVTDIEQICDRVILINHGEKLIDMSLNQMREQYFQNKQIIFIMLDERTNLLQINDIKDMVVKNENHQLIINIDKSSYPVSKVIEYVVSKITVLDLKIKDQELEEIIKNIYQVSSSKQV